MSREVLRVIQDNWGYAVLLPGQGEWARSTDPRLIESYVSLKWLDEAVEAAREANVPEAILEAIAGDDLPIAAVSEKERRRRDGSATFHAASLPRAGALARACRARRISTSRG